MPPYLRPQHVKHLLHALGEIKLGNIGMADIHAYHDARVVEGVKDPREGAERPWLVAHAAAYLVSAGMTGEWVEARTIFSRARFTLGTEARSARRTATTRVMTVSGSAARTSDPKLL